MHTDTIAQRRICAWPLFIAGCLGLALVLMIDDHTWQPYALTEGWPDYTPGHIIRSMIICLSVFGTLWSFIRGKRPKFSLTSDGGMPIERLSIIAALIIAVLCLACFLFYPSYFSSLSLEDGLIEWGSALWVLAGSILFVLAFIKCRTSGLGPAFQMTCLFFALVFFLIGMEEVSWFQRVGNYKTPVTFSSNLQGEMNLHNFSTSLSENGYYFGTFLFLVALPYLYKAVPYFSQFTYMQLFVPRPFIALIGALACAYNFDMWNIIFTQVSFFGAIIILFAFAIYNEDRHEKYLTLAILAVTFITQAAFLMNGIRFSRVWEVTEYKEFIIPLALFVYAIDVHSRIKQAIPGEAAPGKIAG